MIYKTKGIILRRIKYNDNSDIVTIFTKDFGKKAFIVYGINSKRKGNLLKNILTPLYLVKIEFYHKETQSLAKIKEISLDYVYTDIVKNFNKKAILIFLSEVINKLLYENLSDSHLFDYLYNALIILDLQQKNYANFHLVLLIGLMKYLGIMPVNNFSSLRPFFNIKEAQFTSHYDSVYCFNLNLSKKFSELLRSSIEKLETIALDRYTRLNLIRAILNYFQYHIEGFGRINSLEILQNLFE